MDSVCSKNHGSFFQLPGPYMNPRLLEMMEMMGKKTLREFWIWGKPWFFKAWKGTPVTTFWTHILRISPQKMLFLASFPKKHGVSHSFQCGPGLAQTNYVLKNRNSQPSLEQFPPHSTRQLYLLLHRRSMPQEKNSWKQDLSWKVRKMQNWQVLHPQPSCSSVHLLGKMLVICSSHLSCQGLLVTLRR